MPVGLDLARAAPLLGAGITTWSPLRNWGVKEWSRMSVIGRGHMMVGLGSGPGAVKLRVQTKV